MDPFYLYFLPVGYILVSYLLNNADWVNVVEEDLTGTLPAVNVDLIINNAAAVRISGFRHVTNLLALKPSQRFSCKIFNLLRSSISELWQSTTNFITPNGRLIPVQFSAEADQNPSVIEAVLILIQATVNDHQIADCLADMSLTWLWCILRTS
jgi:hypothetical protein